MDSEIELGIESCPVCHEPRSLRETLFHHCGHFVCNGCYQKSLEKATRDQKQVKCCSCNLELTHDPHRIYIGIEDLVQKPIDPPPKKIDLVDKLDAIDEYTPAISVEKASSKIRKLIEQEGNGQDIQKDIASALQRLDERTAPMFKKVAELETQIAELQEQNNRLRISEAAHKETAKKAEMKLEEKKEYWKTQSARLEKYRREKLSAENKVKKTEETAAKEIEAQKKKIRLLNNKLKVLSKPEGKKRRTSVNLDSSLVVEAPLNFDSDIETNSSTRRVKRRKEISEGIEHNVLL